jgi:predicted nucleic acid-binding protein
VKAVVDTNVVAYLLLGTEAFVEESRACFERVTTPLAPAHWEAELTNVVWMAVRAGVLSAADGPVRLGLARRLGLESIATATLCQGALLRAIESGVSVYDTLFVELAARSACPLVTFDKALLNAFPDIARRPRDLVGR